MIGRATLKLLRTAPPILTFVLNLWCWGLVGNNIAFIGIQAVFDLDLFFFSGDDSGNKLQRAGNIIITKSVNNTLHNYRELRKLLYREGKL